MTVPRLRLPIRATGSLWRHAKFLWWWARGYSCPIAGRTTPNEWRELALETRRTALTKPEIAIEEIDATRAMIETAQALARRTAEAGQAPPGAHKRPDRSCNGEAFCVSAGGELRFFFHVQASERLQTAQGLIHNIWLVALALFRSTFASK
jgi:hypothetical protein